MPNETITAVLDTIMDGSHLILPILVGRSYRYYGCNALFCYSPPQQTSRSGLTNSV